MGDRRITTGLGVLALLLTGCSTAGPPPQESIAATTQSGSSPTTSAPTATTTASASVTASLQQALKQVTPGVVRIEAAMNDGEGCGLGQGSGFMAGPGLVVTAAHVVQGGSDIRVIDGTTMWAARVIGIDPAKDVALLRVPFPDTPDPLQLAKADPVVGDAVAAVGFTMGEGISFKPGTVNGLDRKAQIGGVMRYGLIELDAAAAPGNSGGPVINANADVVGLLDAGPTAGAGGRLAVPASTIATLVNRWKQAPQNVTAPVCRRFWQDTADLSTKATAAQSAASHTLDTYFNAINSGDFATAYAQLAPSALTLATFKANVASSKDEDLLIKDVATRGGSPVIHLQFVSQQEAGKGPKGRESETCTLWNNEYTFVQHNDVWLIKKGGQAPGYPRSQPCP